jgi:hypothetical protein
LLCGTASATTAVPLAIGDGEHVRVRDRRAIESTLDRNNRNRGLRFDREALRYCGARGRVVGRVSRLIDERTGEMLETKNECLLIEGMTCTGQYHSLCTRSSYLYWREVWLDRCDPPRAPCFARC